MPRLTGTGYGKGNKKVKNERRVGTVSRGIRCPIIREGDDLSVIVTDSVLEAAEAEGFSIRDRDVIAVTESIVARAQGNYATVDNIAEDVRTKTGGGSQSGSCASRASRCSGVYGAGSLSGGSVAAARTDASDCSTLRSSSTSA